MCEKVLSALRPGASAYIQKIDPESPLRRRLMELGMIPGTRVQCVHIAPSGSPIAFEIRGATIAIRRADAQAVTVRTRMPWA